MTIGVFPMPSWLATVVTGSVFVQLALGAVSGICSDAKYSSKPRIFIATDISNEPDDQMSLVRFLTYSNEFNVEGIATVTSTWKNDSIDHTSVYEVLDNFGKARANLNVHVPDAGQYPTEAYLKSKVTTGKAVYGLEALSGNMSAAATKLIEAVDADDDYLWVTCWGGAQIIAEALYHVNATRSASELAWFVNKTRVYSISDQDDAGPWIRRNFPDLMYIVSIHGFNNYGSATWTGISGEEYYHFDVGGPNTTIVTNSWLDTHIRAYTPLGDSYPTYAYIMEGDTPSFMYLIPNGLNVPSHPEYGGWGGRYTSIDASLAQSHTFSNAEDFVVGIDNKTHMSSQASIWRWRTAYQNDFAARMRWSASSSFVNTTSDVNHAPIVVVNDTCGPEPLELTFTYTSNSSTSVVLDASESWDPDDGDSLSFHWLHYREANRETQTDLYGTQDAVSQNVTFSALNDNGSLVRVVPTANMTFNIVLTVTDDRSMELHSYRRIILYPN